MDETLCLADLPRVLREMTGKRATYARIYRLIIDGDLPAKRNATGRWSVNRADVPIIAETLGLVTKGAE